MQGLLVLAISVSNRPAPCPGPSFESVTQLALSAQALEDHPN